MRMIPSWKNLKQHLWHLSLNILDIGTKYLVLLSAVDHWFSHYINANNADIDDCRLSKAYGKIVLQDQSW